MQSIVWVNVKENSYNHLSVQRLSLEGLLRNCNGFLGREELGSQETTQIKWSFSGAGNQLGTYCSHGLARRCNTQGRCLPLWGHRRLGGES